MTLAAIDSGMSYHTRTLRQGPYESLFSHLIPLPELANTDLSAFPTLLVPCRTNGNRLAEQRDVFKRYLDQGGFLVVLGETRPDLFLDGVDLQTVPTNFWWWLQPGADLGVRLAEPAHPLMTRLRQADLTWHIHGTFRKLDGGTTLAVWEDDEKGGPILVDAQRGNGRLLITTLDPIYHHGSGFMPTTTRFLNVFLPWLAEETRLRRLAMSDA